MKNVLLKLSAAIAASQFFALKALALLPPPEIPGIATQVDIYQTITDMIKKVLDFILLIAVVYVIIAGIRLIVSGGDEGEKDKAKKTIIYVVVGILVILVARVVVVFVATQLVPTS